MMKIIHTADKAFSATFDKILNRGSLSFLELDNKVQNIIDAVKNRGDEALIEYTQKFDRLKLKPSSLMVTKKEKREALKRIAAKDKDLFLKAAQRIESFHRKQLTNSWMTTDEQGEMLGQLVSPLQRVGVYVPGGKGAYPSSLLMNVIPARVAGVEEIIVVSPTPEGHISPYLILAAHITGVEKIFKVGGAQAISALAYGTESVPRVVKIVGPGNAYVACAKKLVFGMVDIDMIAGPSEILIISDGGGSPAFAAADLLSQAEHDERASAFMITTSVDFSHKVNREISSRIKNLQRRAIIEDSLNNNGVIIIVEDLEEAINLANEIAPEHLELAIANPFEVLGKIKNAGAVLLGQYSPVALGDYLAGPNHVLPTGGSARFSSPLGVDDFIKKTNLISFSRDALSRIGKDVIRMAGLEKLDAHLQAVEERTAVEK